MKKTIYRKCENCNSDTCIYRYVIDKGNVCVDELDKYNKEHEDRFSFNNTGIPDILLHSLRAAVEPLMEQIAKYMKKGDVLRLNTPVGQVALGMDLSTTNKIGLRWRRAFQCLDNDGNTPDKDVYLISGDCFLVKVPKGDTQALCLSIEELNKLPVDYD